jgi:hypothetical protein
VASLLGSSFRESFGCPDAILQIHSGGINVSNRPFQEVGRARKPPALPVNAPTEPQGSLHATAPTSVAPPHDRR